ncbi:MAG: hypothetical protein MI922_06080 [Bacteroidales bacterium]|nr:hypothetical protein [Bacteroidales bacterium]
MKTLGSILTFLITLALIVGILWGVIIGGRYIFAQFEMLETQQSAVAIIFSVVMLISAFIVAGAIRDKTRNDDRQVHPEKAIIYNNFIDYYIEIRNSVNTQGIVNLRFRSDISLWASKDVLRSYMLFNQYLNELSGDNPKILQQAESVILEMRKDLGLSNQGLKPGNLDNIIFTPHNLVNNNNGKQAADDQADQKSKSHEKSIPTTQAS